MARPPIQRMKARITQIISATMRNTFSASASGATLAMPEESRATRSTGRSTEDCFGDHIGELPDRKAHTGNDVRRA
jgi:hypothetical protein